MTKKKKIDERSVNRNERATRKENIGIYCNLYMLNIIFVHFICLQFFSIDIDFFPNFFHQLRFNAIESTLEFEYFRRRIQRACGYFPKIYLN